MIDAEVCFEVANWPRQRSRVIEAVRRRFGMVSSIYVFHRDLAQAVHALLNLWFWLTPVVCPAEMIPRQYSFILRFNPVYYVIEGYPSLITGVPLWSR